MLHQQRQLHHHEVRRDVNAALRGATDQGTRRASIAALKTFETLSSAGESNQSHELNYQSTPAFQSKPHGARRKSASAKLRLQPTRPAHRSRHGSLRQQIQSQRNGNTATSVLSDSLLRSQCEWIISAWLIRSSMAPMTPTKSESLSSVNQSKGQARWPITSSSSSIVKTTPEVTSGRVRKA